MNSTTSDTNFESMSPAEIRVLIAKDALALLQGERIEADTGWYLRVGHFPVNAENYTKSLQEILGNLSICRACALGALFVATVRRFDKLNVSDIFSAPADWSYPFTIGSAEQSNFFNYLDKFFEPRQRQLIETAYEGIKFEWIDNISEEEWRKAKSFWEKTPYKDERLEVILNNIVSNNGDFVLP